MMPEPVDEMLPELLKGIMKNQGSRPCIVELLCPSPQDPEKNMVYLIVTAENEPKELDVMTRKDG